MPRRWLIGAVLLVAVLVAARAAAPIFIRRAVNDALAGLPGYEAHIGDVDLALWRGAYAIDDLVIARVGGSSEPFVDIPTLDLSMSWRALFFEHALVGEIAAQRPRLTLMGGEGPTQLGPRGVDWRARVERLFPFRLNRLEINDGTVRYRDPGALRPGKPAKLEDLTLSHLFGTVENLTNSLDLDDPLPARAFFVATAFDSGAVRIHADFDPWARHPTFNLDAAARNIPLTRFNGYSDEYGKFDFESGTLSVFTEVAAAKGKFKGYVKPLLKDVAIADPPGKPGADAREPWWRKAWELIVGGASEVVENQPVEQVATKIPFAGRFDDAKVGVLDAAGQLLINAFVRALRPNIDQLVGEGDVQQLKRGVTRLPDVTQDDPTVRKGQDKPRKPDSRARGQ